MARCDTRRIWLYRVGMCWLLLAAHALAGRAQCVLAHAYPDQTEPVKASLELAVVAPNELEGTLTLTLQTKLDQSIAIYVLLPFRAVDAEAPGSGIQVLWTHVSQDATVLSLILPPTLPEKSKSEVRFKIWPKVLESSNVESDNLDDRPNFLLIEDRGSGEATLRFRFDTSSAESFATLAPWVDGMIAPFQITVCFPAGTRHFTIERSDFSNISYGSSPGQQSEDGLVYTMTPGFYTEQHLWIHYVLPISTQVVTLVLHALTVACMVAAPAFLELAEGLLSDTLRSIVTGMLLLVPVALITVTLILGGGRYLIDNLNALVAEGAGWAVAAIVTVLSVMKLLRSRREAPAGADAAEQAQ